MSEAEKSSRLPRVLPTIARLFSRRKLGRYLFCLACLATVIALFYAEEDLRGKRAWQNYERKSKEKGIDLDWRAYIPPPAPDDENFALASPFADLFNYRYTTNRVEWHDTNIWSRMLRFSFPSISQPGRPAPEKEFGDWVHGRPLDLRKWQEYFRAANTNTAMTNKWPVPLEPSQNPAADVLSALRLLGPDLEALRAASARPHSRFPIHYDDLAKAMLPHLAFLLNLARTLQLRAVAELAAGRNQDAFADVHLAFYLADSLQSEPFAISQFVRCRMLEEDLQAVWEGLRVPRWTEDQLKTFQQYLVSFDLLSKYAQTAKADLAFTCAWIDSLASDPLTYYMMDNVQFFSDAQMEIIDNVFPRGWYFQNELSAARFFQDDLATEASPQNQRVYPSLSQTNAQRFNKLPTTLFTFAYKHLGSTLAPHKFAHTQTDINLALVACALERFRLAHGRFPENLDALTPAYLEKLPHDLINGEPLQYRITADGRFILYSVGWNEKDDGGAFPSSPVEENKPRSFALYHAENGDWVWEYPKTD